MQELRWLLRQYSDFDSRVHIVIEFFIDRRTFHHRMALETWISSHRRKQTLYRRVFGNECA